MTIEKIVLITILIVNAIANPAVSARPDYHDALSKSLIFFEGQRSGKLPRDQTLNWRSDSGLSDGSTENVSAYIYTHQ